MVCDMCGYCKFGNVIVKLMIAESIIANKNSEY